jgi:hypothetical protein
MQECKDCLYGNYYSYDEPCCSCDGYDLWKSKTKPEPYDIKTLLLFHLIEHHPDATPAGCCKTLKEGLKKVTLNGKKQWVLWFNTPDGSTHIAPTFYLKTESNENPILP